MKSVKIIVQVLLLFTLVFSIIEPSFAGIFVEVSPETAQVGDTVTITVTVENDVLVDCSPVIVYAPIPAGLQYLSHVVPDRQRQDYDPDTGIWDVNRMRHDERGHLKYLIITTRVLPQAAGESIIAEAMFEKFVIESTGMDITSQQSPARPDTLTISPIEDGDDNDDNDGGNENDTPGTGGGFGGGNGTGVGTSSGSGTNLLNLMRNFTASSEENPFSNLQRGGGGTGKAYEVSNATDTPTTPQNTLYGILAIVAITAIIALGYYKEIRN